MQATPDRDGLTPVQTLACLALIIYLSAFHGAGKSGNNVPTLANPSWSHSTPPCTATSSSVTYITTMPEHMLEWQFSFPHNSTDLAASTTFSGLIDVQTGQSSWSLISSLNGTAPSHDAVISVPGGVGEALRPMSSRFAQIIPVWGDDNPCQNGGICFLGLQMLGWNDCQRALWWQSAEAPTREGPQKVAPIYQCHDRTQHRCYRFVVGSDFQALYENSLKFAASQTPWSAPFCANVEHPTVTFDSANNEIVMVTREFISGQETTDDDWASCLHTAQIGSGAFRGHCVPLPEFDELLAFAPGNTFSGYPSERLGHSLGNRTGAAADGRPIANPRPYNPKNYAKSSRAFLLVPTTSGNYLSVLRSVGERNKDLIATVLRRTHSHSYEVTKSVQIDGMRMSYVMNLPDSQAGDHLLLLGTGPPYMSLVHSLDLASGQLAVYRSSLF